jgi:hypothetical protein
MAWALGGAPGFELLRLKSVYLTTTTPVTKIGFFLKTTTTGFFQTSMLLLQSSQ